MPVSEFIFSKKTKNRIARHLAFWLMYYIHTALSLLPGLQIKNFMDPALYTESLYEAIEFLPVYLFSVYFSIYYVLPKYLVKRDISFLVLSILILAGVAGSSGYFISIMIFENSDWQWDELDVVTLASRKCISVLIVITGAAVIIKIMKDFFLRQRESEMLVIENTRNKIQLLKMQMHPRFLFECLHNIHTDIKAGTVYAPEMILKLSDLLSYFLYEGEWKQVPLSMEVRMIGNYIALKKLEYKNKLDIYFKPGGEMNAYYITPGLFLSLLEVGIVPLEKLNKPLSVSVELKTDASKLYFTLKNNFPGIVTMRTPYAQATLDSLKKRLQVSYLSKFKLEAHSTADGLALMFQLELDKIMNRQTLTTQNGESLKYEHS